MSAGGGPGWAGLGWAGWGRGTEPKEPQVTSGSGFQPRRQVSGSHQDRGCRAGKLRQPSTNAEHPSALGGGQGVGHWAAAQGLSPEH